MEKDYLLDKWLNGELTKSEWREFRRREDYDQLLAILDQAKAFKASNFSEIAEYDQFKAKLQATDLKEKKPSWIRPLLRIAAVLLVGAGLFYYLYADNEIRIDTLAAEKKTIELPDASIVVVNALSQLNYDPSTWDEQRALELKGEAFFDVSKGASFVVNTEIGKIEVLGTEFNVKHRSGFFEVKCFEGKVRVSIGDQQEELEAGDNIRLTGKKLELGSNLYEEPQWTNNLSNFQRVPLFEVIAELERQYNIKIVLRDVRPNILFTGAFEHGDLDLALQSVTVPLDLQYRSESSNQVTIYPSEN